MPQSLNVIALISGGKDSFFSLLHCLRNDHHVIALANLYPAAASETSDLNSYMYQTVGHTVIPLYEQALGLPLYRRRISGTALNSEKDYRPPEPASTYGSAPYIEVSQEDETESLFHLLKEVKAAQPGADAVSSGAILSTYQRTRIESVALRLGLIPLAYLWQYPSLPTLMPRPGGLLQDMSAVALDARIVKVASGGLNEGLLWGSLKDEKVTRKVEKDAVRFGGSVLGEGGEYETLVVSGPSPVWRRRLEIHQEAREIVRAEGGEYWIAFKGGKVSDLLIDQGTEDWRHRLNVPVLWDREFAQLRNSEHVVANVTNDREEQTTPKSEAPDNWTAEENISRTSNSITISNITTSSHDSAITEQMISINRRLNEILQKHDSSADNIVFTTLLLRSMQDFAAINSVYATLFTKPNPPARVTVACGDMLPRGVDIMASLVTDAGPRETRLGLHVQSRSYWAPANIGPYSQAICISIPNTVGGGEEDPYLVYIAGQIPLIPASMEILGRPEIFGPDPLQPDLLGFWEQTCLSLQHLWRIGRTTGVTWWTIGIAFITGHDHIQAKARLAYRAWKMLHERTFWKDESAEEDEFVDIWAQKHGGQGTLAHETPDRCLPAFDHLATGLDVDQALPGFLAVQVDELPRGCSIEWQGLGVAHNKAINVTRSSNETTVHISSDSNVQRYISTTYIASTVWMDDVLSHPAWAGHSAPSGNETSHSTVYTRRPRLLCKARAQVIPCRSVWGEEGLELAAGIVRHVDIACEVVRSSD